MINSSKIVCFIIILNSVILSIHSSNVQVLCGNDNCTEPISNAKTLLSYNANESWKITFSHNTAAKVLAEYKKENKTEFYKIKIGEKIGWAPASAIRVDTILIKKKSLKQVSVPDELVLKLQGKLQGSETSINESQIEKQTSPLPDTTENNIVTKPPDSVNKDSEKQPDASQVQQKVEEIDGTQIREEWYNTTTVTENYDSSENKLQNDQNLSNQNNNTELDKLEEKISNETTKESPSDNVKTIFDVKNVQNVDKNLNDSNFDPSLGEDKVNVKEPKNENNVDTFVNITQSSTNEVTKSEKEKNQDNEKTEKSEPVENEDQISIEKTERNDFDSSKNLNEEQQFESELSKESANSTQFNNNFTKQENVNVTPDIPNETSFFINNTDEIKNETIYNQNQSESNKNEIKTVKTTLNDKSENKTENTNVQNVEPKLNDTSAPVHESKSENLNSTEVTSVNESKSENLNSTEMTSVNESKSENLNSTEVTSVNESKSENLNSTEMTSVNESKSENLNSTEVTSMRESKSENLNSTEVTSVNESKSKNLNSTEVTSVNESKSENLNSTEVTSVNESKSENLNSTEVTSMRESKSESENSTENYKNQADSKLYLSREEIGDNSIASTQKDNNTDYNTRPTTITREPTQDKTQTKKTEYPVFPQVSTSDSNSTPNDHIDVPTANTPDKTILDKHQTEESTEQTQIPILSQQVTTDNSISHNEFDPNIEQDLVTTTVSYKAGSDNSAMEEKKLHMSAFTNTVDDNLTPPIEEETLQNPDTIKENTEVEDKNFLNSMYEYISNLWLLSSNVLSSYNKNKNDETLQGSTDSEENTEHKENNDNLDNEYCEKLTPNSCPKNKKVGQQMNEFKQPNEKCSFEYGFIPILSETIFGMIDVFVCLLITAITSLLFSFGYYCICNNRHENVLLSKLNIVERSLLASNKESLILKHELLETRNKLTSIEDNSFGSNDMVIALKKELETHREQKIKLQEQIAALEKELENAAEAGLELNKIVSELLSNQSGDDSIISSVEELQKQLNEQQITISQINATLAEKSKENSELQLLLSEQAIKFQTEINSLKQQNQDLENDKTAKVDEYQEKIKQLTEQLSKTVDEKSFEIKKLNDELGKYKIKYEDINKKCQINTARVKVLEECLSSMRENPKLDIKNILDLTNLKTDNQVLIQERDSLKEHLETEMDNRKLLENRVKAMTEEVTMLKQEYDKSEKDKLEAQTRLEVLSGYFKEKETQLQKELSVKEAMWLKQQGETTNTVERVRLMQDEIQSLKSQNDSLRAEIEAQIATHKTQINILENRAHETWVAARHSERKYEEARQEATILRRKLTSLSSNPIGNETDLYNRNQNTVDGLVNQINNTSSPIHMESPSSPLLSNLPPPPPFLPPPFMPPPHGFLPLPPPLVPPSELRPPPLGRLMSPPPPAPPQHGVYSQNMIDEERHRYSPDNGRFSPIDSNYNYNPDLMSAYDTETDFSLPPSPQNRTGYGGERGYNSRERERVSYSFKGFSHSSPNSDRDRSKKLKGTPSSGSEDS